jgi:putative transposase
VRQSFQFKLFACKRLKHLHGTIDLSAQIWNHSVALKNRYYKMFGRGLPKARLQSHLAKLRNRRFPHWKAVGSQSVQAILIGSTLLGKRSSKGTSNGLPHSVRDASIDRSH